MSGESLSQEEASEAAETLANLLDQVDHAKTTVRQLQSALEAQLGRHVPRQWIRGQVDQGCWKPQARATLSRQNGERPQRSKAAKASQERCAPPAVTSHSLSEIEQRTA